MSKNSFNAETAPALMAFLGAAGIKLVDIGGRGAAMVQLTPLAPVAHYYTCEPDVEEAQRLRETLPQMSAWRDITVLTEAIASRRGDATLYLTRQPGMSSLLEPDTDVSGRFYLGHKFLVDRTTTVPAIPLDEAAVTYGFTDACFLKIDTQGTELDILESGRRLVSDALMGVYVECSFRPFYKNQALFGDVDRFLRENGFELFTMSRTSLRRSGYRPALYSRRITTWAHCLYLREPERLLAGSEPARAARGIPQLIALAMAFHHHDLAFELIEMAGRIGLLSGPDLEQVSRDMETVATVSTRIFTRMAQREVASDAALLAPDQRDRKRIE